MEMKANLLKGLCSTVETVLKASCPRGTMYRKLKVKVPLRQ